MSSISLQSSPKVRQGGATAVLFACSCFFAALLAPTADAQSYDPDDTIIVFGGFGYLDDAQQPRLHELVRRKADGHSMYPQLGSELEFGVARDALEILAETDLSKWTAYPVIFSPEDLAAAYQARTGETSYDTAKMFSAFERSYLLVLSGGFEHQSIVPAGETFSGYATVGVSATLVDLNGSNDIVLSATHFGIRGKRTNLIDTLDTFNGEEEWIARFAVSYRDAAGGALRMLGQLAQKSNPSKVVNEWDTYMITGAFLAPHEETAAAADLFGWRSSGDFGSFCQPVNHCESGAESCRAMIGYLTTATGQALAEAGLKVMPPIQWSERARDSNSIVSYKLSLPSSGLPNLVKSAGFVYDPDRAAYKVVPVLLGTTLRSALSEDGTYVEDSYGATVILKAGRTATSDCSSVIQESTIGSIASAKIVDEKVRAPGSEETAPSGQQLMTLLAMKAAVLKFSESLR